MSLANQLASAARQAQRTLSGMADPDNAGEFTIAGVTGTFTATIEEDPNMLIPTPNGLEKVYGLRLAAERSQFTAAQETTLATLSGTRARVTAKGKAWSLITITQQAQFQQLVCVIA
jgi:hypothetical protein